MKEAGQGRGQAYGTEEGVCRLQGGVCLSPRAMGSHSRLYATERHEGQFHLFTGTFFVCHGPLTVEVCKCMQNLNGKGNPLQTH